VALAACLVVLMGTVVQAASGSAEYARMSQPQLEEAARHGNAGAMFHLGKRHDEGRGVPVNATEALRWYRKAAEAGDARAQFVLAGSLMVGDGVKMDRPAAVRWFRKAADGGLVAACNELGVAHLHGRGVAKDPRTALAWFRKGAEGGDAGAQENMVVACASGLGMKANRVEAIKWACLCSAQAGSKKKTTQEAAKHAEAMLASLRHEATPAEVARGEAAASAWVARRKRRESGTGG
jgi:hypothetical protein